MTRELVPLRPEELEEARQFLIGVYQCPPDLPFIRPDHFYWKCFATRPDWPGARPHVIREAGRIIAFGCITPATYVLPERTIRGIEVIDWAADKNFRGAGQELMNSLAALAETNMGIGGTPPTRHYFRKTSKPFGGMDLFARPLRPLNQIRATPHLNWKLPARAMRNVAWSTRPLAPSNGWNARRVGEFGEEISELVTDRRPRLFTRCLHTAETLNYFLSSPMVKFEGYTVERKGRTEGYFMLASVLGQTRIVDLLMRTDDQNDWNAAFAVATRTALVSPENYEIMSGVSFDLARVALQANNFHLRDSWPIMIHDPKDVLAQAPPMNITMLEADCAHITDAASPFLT